MSFSEAVCVVCKEPSTKHCSSCKEVSYCSVACQRIDWTRGHRDLCWKRKTLEHGELYQHTMYLHKDNKKIAYEKARRDWADGKEDSVPEILKLKELARAEFAERFDVQNVSSVPDETHLLVVGMEDDSDISAKVVFGAAMQEFTKSGATGRNLAFAPIGHDKVEFQSGTKVIMLHVFLW